ncbi:MAG TPA: hypothetical protein VIK35_03190 [Verrucomicrobiae bacterium]
MSYVPKAFYGFLVFVMLVSFVGSWQSLAKMHEQERGAFEWFYGNEEYPHQRSLFGSLTVQTVVVLNSTIGKIAILTLMIAVSIGSWKMAFKYEYLYTGLLVFLAFASFFAWIAIKLRFIDPFMPMIRM